jgi:hypothetical protein
VNPTAAAAINPAAEVAIILLYRAGYFVWTSVTAGPKVKLHEDRLLAAINEGEVQEANDAHGGAQGKKIAALRRAIVGLAFAVLACVWGSVLEAVLRTRSRSSSVGAGWATVPYILVSFAEVLFTTNVLKYATLLHRTSATVQEAVFFLFIGLGAVLLDLVAYLASLGKGDTNMAQYIISAVVIFLSASAFAWNSLKGAQSLQMCPSGRRPTW